MPRDPGFFEVLRRQRACRAFDDRPVGDDELARLLEAATWAPSAENAQPWHFVVVRDAQARRRIGELTERMWKAGGRAAVEGHLDARLLTDVEQGATGGIASAPVIVVVAADSERGVDTAIEASIFPAVQNLLLAATASGLGSALTTLVTYAGDDLRAEIGLPDHVRPMAVVPLGHPARTLGPPRREPFPAHTHRERFGIPW